MNSLERVLRRADRFQQRHAVAAFPIAVAQKFGNDRAGAFATRIAYQGLFSLFPLLLLFTTILGFVLEDRPELRDDIIDSALADFPIIGTEVRQATEPLQGSAVGLTIGIVGTLYGGLGVGRAAMAGMNTVWNIPRRDWPNFALRRVRSLGIILGFGVAAILSAGLSAASASLAAGAGRPIALVGTVAIDAALFLWAFMVLTAEPLRPREVGLGALLAAIFWGALKLVGTWYVGRVLRNASDVYGFFATVIALLSWIYLAAQLTLLAAEINVVRKYHLWPRSVTQPPLTEADRMVFTRLAEMSVRRPEYAIEMHFLPEADFDPLAEAEDDDRDAGVANSTFSHGSVG